MEWWPDLNADSLQLIFLMSESRKLPRRLCFLHGIFSKSYFEHFMHLCCTVLRLKQNLTQMHCSFIREPQIVLNIHSNTWWKAVQRAVVTKLTGLSQKIVILCHWVAESYTTGLSQSKWWVRKLWLCFCMCAAPTTISQPVLSLFKMELDALWNMWPSHLICIAASKFHTHSSAAICDFILFSNFICAPK